jgi:dienelactone hydrolase
MRTLFVSAVIVLASAFSFAGIQTQTVEYKDGDVICKGFVAFDDANEKPRPAVLVIPEWWGLDDYAKSRCKQLAELGYVAMAADMYGEGKTTNDPKQAGEWAGALRGDRTKLGTRAEAALKTLKEEPKIKGLIAPNQVAAIGYCFGGTTVLEMARGGSDVVGVVSFHGGLDFPEKFTGPIKPKILVCAGANDPMVPARQVSELEEQLKQAKADFQINIYANADHSFTNPQADTHKIAGISYNEKADKRSWEAMKAFFNEIFKK